MTLNDKKRLRWQCRRGMLELEIVLNDFLEYHYDELSEDKKHMFVDLLTLIDPLLYDYLMGTQIAEKQAHRDIINIIKQTSRKG